MQDVPVDTRPANRIPLDRRRSLTLLKDVALADLDHEIDVVLGLEKRGLRPTLDPGHIAPAIHQANRNPVDSQSMVTIGDNRDIEITLLLLARDQVFDRGLADVCAKER